MTCLLLHSSFRGLLSHDRLNFQVNIGDQIDVFNILNGYEYIDSSIFLQN